MHNDSQCRYSKNERKEKDVKCKDERKGWNDGGRKVEENGEGVKMRKRRGEGRIEESRARSTPSVHPGY